MKDAIKKEIGISLQIPDNTEISCTTLAVEDLAEAAQQAYVNDGFEDYETVGRRVAMADHEDSHEMVLDVLFDPNVMGSTITLWQRGVGTEHKTLSLPFYDDALYEFCKLAIATIDAKRENVRES